MLKCLDFRVTCSPSLTNSLSAVALNAPMVASIDARCVIVLLSNILLSFCPLESLYISNTKENRNTFA